MGRGAQPSCEGKTELRKYILTVEDQNGARVASGQVCLGESTNTVGWTKLLRGVYLIREEVSPLSSLV